MKKWRHVTWEKGDCVYEGLQLKIGSRYKLVGFWFVCGLDNCPSSTKFGHRKMTDKQVSEEFDCSDTREKCLQNAQKIQNGEEVNLRIA